MTTASFQVSTETLLQEITESPPIQFTRPDEIGCFSYDIHRTLSLERSQLVPNFNIYIPQIILQKKYCFTPEICGQLGDLNHNYATFVEKSARSHLFPILAVLNEQMERPKAEFITWRGVLTRIMSTAFDHKSKWAMYGTVRNDKIYLEEERLPQDNSPKSKLQSYWGHKFENLCMVDHKLPLEAVQPLIIRREESVNTNEEFGIVLKVRLGDHRFVIGAEVDGIDEQGNEYIELKTSKTPSSQFDEKFFKEKLMKYWLQSYLAGIPKVLVGFRDKKGFIKSLEYYKVNEMPRLVRGRVRWDPNAILLMGNQFFTWLKNQISSDKTVYGSEFSFQLRHNHNGAGLIEYSTTTEISVELPDWYKYY